MEHLLNCIHDEVPLKAAEKELDTSVCLWKFLWKIISKLYVQQLQNKPDGRSVLV